MSEEEAMGVVSNLVRAQAIVGTGAAIREGCTPKPGPPCLVCALLCSPDTCTYLCGTIGTSVALYYGMQCPQWHEACADMLSGLPAC